MPSPSTISTPGPLPLPIFTVRSDAGLKHKTNQDAVEAIIPNMENPYAFFAVADGVSSLPNSEIASQLAIKVTRLVLSGKAAKPVRPSDTDEEEDDDRTLGRPPELHPESFLKQAVYAALKEASLEVQKQAVHDNFQTMGTTIAGLWVGPNNIACIFSVGDSRVYRLHDHQLELLTKDQVASLPPQSPNSPQPVNRNVRLSAYIGQHGLLNPFMDEREVKPNDRFLICTDGLWSMIAESELQQYLESDDLGQASDRLLKRVIQLGAPDDVSFIMVSYDQTDPRRSLSRLFDFGRKR